jgi:hypothetical protein
MLPIYSVFSFINPLNAELNPICHLLALLGGATILVVSRLRANLRVSALPNIFIAVYSHYAELNPICHLLALLGGATIVVVSRLRVNLRVSALPNVFIAVYSTLLLFISTDEK